MLCNRLGRVGIGIFDVGSSEYSKRLIVAGTSLILTSSGNVRLDFCQRTCRTHVAVFSHNVLSLEGS